MHMSLDEAFANEVPKPELPYMPDAARAALRDVMAHERPVSNGCMKDVLLFAAARGYYAHPADWIPTFRGDNRFPAIYQPMVNWLAENGHIPFFEGVALTEGNFDGYSARTRCAAFRNLLRADRSAAYDLLLSVGARKNAQVRFELLSQIDAGGGFAGIYPTDVPVLQKFLNDPSKKVRGLVERKLESTWGLDTREAHAKAIAHHFTIGENGDLFIAPEFPEANLIQHCWSTDLDALARVLGVSSMELVSNVSLEDFKGNVFKLFPRTGDIEARKVLAKRLVTAGLECPASLIGVIAPEDWKKALRKTFKSELPSTVFDFLGDKAGTLDISMVRQIRHYSDLKSSVLEELNSGTLPINHTYDSLRILALVADKEAANAVMREAIDAGIAENNPRLAMLKFNLSL